MEIQFPIWCNNITLSLRKCLISHQGTFSMTGTLYLGITSPHTVESFIIPKTPKILKLQSFHLMWTILFNLAQALLKSSGSNTVLRFQANMEINYTKNKSTEKKI